MRRLHKFLLRPASSFCNLPVVREQPILAPKWPRGDLHTDGLLGTLEDLLCDVGAHVREFETVAIIETDKVSVDVKAPANGVIVAVLATCGQTVDESQPLYTLREEAAFVGGAEGAQSSEHTEAREWARRHAERLNHEQEEQARLWETQRLRMRPDWQWSRHESHGTQNIHTSGDAHGSQRRTTQREKQQWQQWQKRQQRAYESAQARVRWWEWRRGADAAGAGPSSGSDYSGASNTSASADGASRCQSPVARVLAASGHYEVLGVPRGASGAEIKRAFNRCAMQVHPDRCSAANAQEAMVRLGLAYHALCDGRRRRVYDAGTGRRW
jgi:pyruvate/2-oxoglutarate dehydrogenase complex dihydrolipoamide acyltransferase (E2) component